MIDYQIWDNEIPQHQLTQILQLYQLVFQTDDLTKFYERINNEKGLVVITATHDDNLVGFKIGYQKSEQLFYSWLGAIHPSHRKQGIASHLMQIQHDWAKQNHFKLIETKTMNRWKDMLILNLKHGFDIQNTYLDTNGNLKIILQKELK